MKKTLFLALIVSLAAGAAVFAAPPPAAREPITVRVCILDTKDEIALLVKDRYAIFAAGSDRVVMEGAWLAAKVVATRDGIGIGKKEFKIGGVRVRAEKDSMIFVGGKRFRGEVDIIRKDNGKLMVVNYVGLDDYLYGVLYHEVSHRWPMEVLKAQAIVARTFALYQAGQNRLQPYDLRSDIYSQVYGGSASEKWSTTMAVNVTKGKVLVYKGELLPAYYHATCGGMTEDAANLWKIDIPPLRGGVCGYCDESPYRRWIKDVPLWMVEEKLRTNGYRVGKIDSVAILARTRSGRVDKLEIKDRAGVSVVLTGKDLRQILGPNELRSTMFDASIKWGSLIFDGQGWGHGVGMCQWGACGMAKKGRKADEILRRYYPEAEITTIDKIRDGL